MTKGLTRIIVEPREPLASEIVRRLLDYLFSGEVTPGDRIPSERQLADSLGVNRPAVREALRALTFLGLLEIRHGSGTYFRDPEQDLLFSIFELSLLYGKGRLRDLTEARAELETSVAALAATRRSQTQVEELGNLLSAMKNASLADFAEADLAFHAKIAEAAGNVVLREMLRGVRTIVRKWVDQNVRAAATTKIAYRDHVPIFEAIRDQDTDGARSAMVAHMAGATKRMLKASHGLSSLDDSSRATWR